MKVSLTTTLSASLLLSASAISLHADRHAAETPPNILFILVDDLGWNSLGSYGSVFFDTPHLDRLAEQSVRFTDAYSPSPACTPSRYAILTGKSPARTGITHIPFFNRWPTRHELALRSPHIPERVPDHVRTLAHQLQERGYVTGQGGKWHMYHTQEEFGFDVGFTGHGIHEFPGASTTRRDNNQHIWDRFENEFPDLAEGEFLECELVTRAIDFMNDNKDRHWFYYYDPFLVHTPILSRHKWLIDKYRERFEKQGIELVNPTYAAMVETLDHTVGQLLDELERLGLRDNTIIIFSSDNGAVAELHAHPFIVSDNSPLFQGKVTMYEGGIRVPLLVDWPGVTEPGRVTDVPVDLKDLFPTILEMVGAEIPSGQVHDGVSWVPLLRGEENFERGPLYWHYPHIVNPRPRFPGRDTHFVGVARQGDWKLILSYEDDSMELFNLRDDIGESNNLAKTHPERAQQMKRDLQTWLRDIGANMPRKK